jgi:hypothetical protein
MTTTTVVRGNASTQMLLMVSLTPPNVGANTTAEGTYTIQGIPAGSFCEVNKPSHTTGLSIGNVRVPSVNTVVIQFVNSTAAPLNSNPTENYQLSVVIPESVTLPSSV